jgi:hypothetical protein
MNTNLDGARYRERLLDCSSVHTPEENFCRSVFVDVVYFVERCGRA